MHKCPETSLRATSGKPVLTVLVPAYEYAEGIKRILNSLAGAPHGLVTCIVGDDSHSSSVETVISQHPARPLVAYYKNQPPLGAVGNWNALLARARTDYVMLLHHDECPVAPDFFQTLVPSLDGSKDAFILDCAIANRSVSRMRRHVPFTLKRLLLRHPEYLLRRNFLGPPSVFVVKRSRLCSFDTQLSWLVDVDWYVRLLSQPNFAYRLCGKLTLLSVNHSGAITRSFTGRQSACRMAESALIGKKAPRSWPLRLNSPTTLSDYLFSAAESVVWSLVRVAIRAWTWLFSVRLASEAFGRDS